MTQLSSTVNPRQPGTLLRNTVQNLKNNVHCIVVTTRGGKQTVVPLMSSCVESVIRCYDEVVEVSCKL